jgi:hypothetical protein
MVVNYRRIPHLSKCTFDTDNPDDNPHVQALVVALRQPIHNARYSQVSTIRPFPVERMPLG